MRKRGWEGDFRSMVKTRAELAREAEVRRCRILSLDGLLCVVNSEADTTSRRRAREEEEEAVEAVGTAPSRRVEIRRSL